MLIKKKKRRIKVKHGKYKKIKYNSGKELRFIKETERYKKILPTKPKRILTPFGYYTPDFELDDFLIEIKSLHTLACSFGLKNYLNKGISSNLQSLKIKWVNENVKPIIIIIYLGRREKIPNWVTQEKNIIFQWKGGYIPKKLK